MGEIQLRGRVFRDLAGGRMPWRVLISGWSLFGGIFWLLWRVAVNLSSVMALIHVAIAEIPLFILRKEIKAKLSSKRRRRL
ncbi:hypothetical protein STA3757_07270 [Stanieria sp. NIES-3757]|nr:hypothetical protein STA3757_07270 [Stanieria sp. NIES-3757]